MEMCMVGAGRIAEIHSRNIYNHKKINLKYVIDINFKAAKKIAIAATKSAKTNKIITIS